ncbi:MAG: hypothetical protein D6769_00510 [Methanobacteriota archaeon]|nr:MAG: hypothetical protein D6769_00510 [Euryarchaeota archaeon]
MILAYMDKAPGKYIVEATEKEHKKLLVENVLDFESSEEVVVASPHKSKEGKAAITVHYPGNPTRADYGGKEMTLNVSNPFLSYRLYVETIEALEEDGIEIEITYEADHHGPTIEKPIVFYELGSNEEQWNNRAYCSLMGKVLDKALESNETPSSIFLAVGGNHYANKFNKLTRKKGFAYTHILAKYSLDELTREVFGQALQRSLAVAEAVLIDKKGTTKEQKEKIKSWCDDLNISAELI